MFQNVLFSCYEPQLLLSCCSPYMLLHSSDGKIVYCLQVFLYYSTQTKGTDQTGILRDSDQTEVETGHGQDSFDGHNPSHRGDDGMPVDEGLQHGQPLSGQPGRC